MSIEVNPIGIACNLDCPYCYQHEMRNAGNITKNKDIEKIKEQILKQNSQFSVFGGEALLAHPDDLRELFEMGIKHFKGNGIQTNATLITDEHIEMFKKYKVHVGISMDGLGEMNDSRWAGTLEKTREATQKSAENIDRLIANGIIPSLIITLYKGNARGDRLDRLCDWLIDLDSKGINSVRIHALEIDQGEVAETMALSDEENYRAFIRLYNLEKNELQNIKFDVFNDIRKLLKGDDNNVTCVWNACDQYTTVAVQGIDENGDLHNCGRTNKQGVNWHKSETHGKERQLALYHTPWEHGGCKGCRFFIHCKGQCTGAVQGGDWRNKSASCFFWYRLLEKIEKDLLEEGELPTSLHPRLQTIESLMLSRWANGHHASIKDALNMLNGKPVPVQSAGGGHGDEHGDKPHGDHTDNTINQQHGDEHGDRPHGDSNQ